MPPTDYRAVESLGWVDGYRGALAVFAMPAILWARAIVGRVKGLL